MKNTTEKKYSGYERDGVYLMDRMDEAHLAASCYLQEVDETAESVATAANWLEGVQYGDFDYEDPEVRAQAWTTADWLIEYCKH